MMIPAQIVDARKKYHASLLQSVLTINKDGIPSNADKDSKLSVSIAKGIAENLESTTGERLAGQTSGSAFETINAEFVRDTFLTLNHMTMRSTQLGLLSMQRFLNELLSELQMVADHSYMRVFPQNGQFVRIGVRTVARKH